MAAERNGKYRSWVEVDLDNFSHNWQEVKRLIGEGVKVLQVVKADAYGHGAIEISNVALKNGALCLGVANADEGVQLRVGGITAPIVILSPSTISEAAAGEPTYFSTLAVSSPIMCESGRPVR